MKTLHILASRAACPLPNAVAAMLLASTALCSSAYAQATPPQQTETPGNPSVTPAEKPYAPPANLSEWASSIKLDFQGDVGITVNPASPDNRTNFGRLFDDAANRPLLNQALLTYHRDVDPKATSPDVGFKLQLMYGSDARIVHVLGVFDQLIHDRNQLAVTEANISVRLPDIFKNGLDIKAGLYPTPLGVELIDPKTNAFYSHSYIFNYGLPYEHIGALAVAHTSDLLDVYLGVDSGTNVAVGYGTGDNNNRPAGIAGLGFNMLDGKLTLLALTHMGPENSKRNTPFANSAMRYYNDLAIVWKASDKLTLTTEGNYVKDDGVRAEAWGLTQYASYALSDTVTLNSRAEIFRDNTNFFVSTPVGYLDYVAAERGTFGRFYTAPKPTTYTEFTAGLTYKPSWTPQQLSTLLVRPEIRYDQTLNNSRVFNDGKDRGAVTLATDLIIGF